MRRFPNSETKRLVFLLYQRLRCLFMQTCRSELPVHACLPFETFPNTATTAQERPQTNTYGLDYGRVPADTSYPQIQKRLSSRLPLAGYTSSLQGPLDPNVPKALPSAEDTAALAPKSPSSCGLSCLPGTGCGPQIGASPSQGAVTLPAKDLGMPLSSNASSKSGVPDQTSCDGAPSISVSSTKNGGPTTLQDIETDDEDDSILEVSLQVFEKFLLHPGTREETTGVYSLWAPNSDTDPEVCCRMYKFQNSNTPNVVHPGAASQPGWYMKAIHAADEEWNPICPDDLGLPSAINQRLFGLAIHPHYS